MRRTSPSLVAMPARSRSVVLFGPLPGEGAPRRFGVCPDVMGKVLRFVRRFVIAAVAALVASVVIVMLLSLGDPPALGPSMRGFLSLVALVVVFVVTFLRLPTPDRDGEG